MAKKIGFVVGTPIGSERIEGYEEFKKFYLEKDGKTETFFIEAKGTQEFMTTEDKLPQSFNSVDEAKRNVSVIDVIIKAELNFDGTLICLLERV
jgi:hypothetical protein